MSFRLYKPGDARSSRREAEVRPDPSGYTRRVSWRLRTIGAALVVILAGLPVVGVTCALLCASDTPGSGHASNGASHHGSAEGDKRECDPPSAAADVQIRGSEHDCGIHDGVRQAASVVADRADTSFRFGTAALASIDLRVASTSVVDRQPIYRRPPGTDPPTRTPLVLRV